jgi:serine/threonine-protein phosphatase PGAM5
MRMLRISAAARRRLGAHALAGVVLAAAAPLAAAQAAPPLEAASAGAPAAATVYRTLYLVRHGEYDSSDPRDARVGKELVPIGVAQSRLLGARLAALPVRFTAFRASPLTRARQTAQVLSGDLPGLALEIDPNLEECTPPTRRREIVADETPEALAACRAQLERLFAEWLRPAEKERHDLLVAHGNVIRYLVTRALGVDPTAWLEMSIGNTSLTVIRVEPDGRFKVISVGDVGHLPASLQTGRTGDPPRDLAVP